MRLTLAIENHTSLPDGGPLSVTITGNRGLDIGRDQYLDWTLPDPSRFISGKHCEIRAQNGEYFLYDVSTNGTMLNGASHRLQSPHRLQTGNRLTIGDYIIGVTVETAKGQSEKSAPAASAPSPPSDLWASQGSVAEPVHPNELRPPGSNRPIHGDWIDRAADVPSPVPADFGAFRPLPPKPAPRTPDFDWAPVPAPPPPVAPPPPPVAPTPRRVVSFERGGPWVEESSSVGQQPAPQAPPPVIAPSPAESPGPDQPATPWREAGGPVAASEPGGVDPSSNGVDEFLRAFAAGAGIPEQQLDRQNPKELARKLGGFVRLVVSEMRQLLGARSEAKRMARSSSQTIVQALDNNALKFSPTDLDALRILLGPPQRSYLDAERAVGQGFADLKEHQVRTFAAMQHAVRMMIEDFDPKNIEKNAPADAGISAMLASKKARLWDAYVISWNSRIDRRDNGMMDVFMQYFADYYDRIENGR